MAAVVEASDAMVRQVVDRPLAPRAPAAGVRRASSGVVPGGRDRGDDRLGRWAARPAIIAVAALAVVLATTVGVMLTLS